MLNHNKVLPFQRCLCASYGRLKIFSSWLSY